MLRKRHEELGCATEDRGPELPDGLQVFGGVEAGKYNESIAARQLHIQVTYRAHGVEPGHHYEGYLGCLANGMVFVLVTFHALYTQLAILVGYVTAPEPVGELAAVYDHVVVREHNALGGPSRAACISDVREVFFGIEVQVGRLRLVGTEQRREVLHALVEGRLAEQLGRRRDRRVAVGQAHQDAVAHRCARKRFLRHSEEHVQADVCLRPGIVELEAELALRQQRAHGHKSGAGLQEPEIGDGELRAVGQVQGDPVALVYAHVRECSRKPVRELVQFPVRQLHSSEDDGVALRPLQRG